LDTEEFIIVKNNRLTGGGASTDSGIRHGIVIVDNLIENFTATTGLGACIIGADYGAVIANNQLWNNTCRAGIYVWDEDIITQNRFCSGSYAYAAIQCTKDLKNVVIAHNTMQLLSRNDIIEITDGSRFLIDGNSILECCSNANNSYDAIFLGASCDRMTVINNIIYTSFGNQYRYGIVEESGTDYNLIKNNRIETCATANMVVLGSNTIAKNNLGYNPIGLIATPFETATGIVGILGDEAAPTANTDYVVSVTDLVITCSGGTGVSITIKDASGNTIASALTSLTCVFLPIGYKINFGNFTVAPTTMYVSGN